MHDNTHSLAADSLEIEEVRDRETGELLDARELIGSDKERTLQLRMALQQGIVSGSPLLLCPICSVPVHLVSMMRDVKFYFRHETEDGRCPAKTKGGLSPERILALKYDGARESEAHKRMKEIVAESLRSDPEFSEVEVEKVWKGAEANSRRKPDVRALWRGKLRVAFEVQLSTTFLRVIAERREFYLKEGGLLFWIFKGFDHGDARLTHEDIFYNNNRNAFVASEETLTASRASRSLSLDCVWSEPSVENGRMLWTPTEARCRFSDLTLDVEHQRAFLFDADAARPRCEALLVDQPLRDAFRRYWFSTPPEHSEWLRLRSELAKKGIRLPQYLSEAEGLRPLLDTLYSAEAGEPCAGWDHPNLVVLAHHVFTKYKGHLWAFRLMLLAHDRVDVMRKHDSTGKWAAKAKAYKDSWREGGTDFAPDRRYDRLLCLLFPEISERLPMAPS